MRPLAFTLLFASLAFAQNAEDQFKNIQSFKGTPAADVLPAMQFMAASLGVQCNFCHVQGDNASDEKGEKKTARAMISMQNEINKLAFRGQKQVTCYSCHRGSARPVNVPPVQETDAAPAAMAPTGGRPTGPQITPDQILEKYLVAIGGADAVNKIHSRVMTGKILTGGNESPIEVYTKAPNKRITITKMANGESMTAFDGTAGWMGSTGRPARDMTPAESAASALDAEFALGLHLKEMYPQLRRGRPEKIGDTECEVINGSAPNKPAVRLYFDSKTGLLVRMIRFADNPLGRMPTQIDYADYRDTDGVKIPYRWTLSRPNGRFTIQVASVKSNVDIPDSRFSK